MFGFILVAVKFIMRDLIKGVKATFNTLSPKDVLTTWGTIAVLIPVLVWPISCVDVVVISLARTVQPPAPLPCPATWFVPIYSPPEVVVSTGAPCQKSCHSFHTVSISILSKFGLPKFATIVSNEPCSFTNKSGTLFVSFHSSPGGSNVIEPAQVNMLKGFTFTNLLAYGWSIIVVSVYGNVIKSPVFW